MSIASSIVTGHSRPLPNLFFSWRFVIGAAGLRGASRDVAVMRITGQTWRLIATSASPAQVPGGGDTGRRAPRGYPREWAAGHPGPPGGTGSLVHGEGLGEVAGEVGVETLGGGQGVGEQLEWDGASDGVLQIAAGGQGEEVGGLRL